MVVLQDCVDLVVEAASVSPAAMLRLRLVSSDWAMSVANVFQHAFGVEHGNVCVENTVACAKALRWIARGIRFRRVARVAYGLLLFFVPPSVKLRGRLDVLECTIAKKEVLTPSDLLRALPQPGRTLDTTVMELACITNLDLTDSNVDNATVAALARWLRGVTSLGLGSNPRVTTVEPFASPALTAVAIEGRCGVGDAGLAACTSLTALNATSNRWVKSTMPFAASLLKLGASGACGIGDEGLVNCSHLTALSAYNNPRITKTHAFAATLTDLNASGDCGIGDAGLAPCTVLRVLNASRNRGITMIPPACHTTLAWLDAGHDSGLDDAALAPLSNVTRLVASHNSRISTVRPFADTLRSLAASGLNSAISDQSLEAAVHLEVLSADGNPRITTVMPFAATLRRLSAAEKCGIGDDSLRWAPKLVDVYCRGNPRIRIFAQETETVTDRRPDDDDYGDFAF